MKVGWRGRNRGVWKRANDLFGSKLVDIILFGSFSRGDYNNDSDIDIMILADLKQEQFPQYREKTDELSGDLSLKYEITVSIKLKDSNTVYRYKDSLPFYSNVLKEGVSVNV